MNYEKGPSQKYVIWLAYSGERILVHGGLSQVHNFCLWCWFGHWLKCLHYNAFLMVLSEEITVLCYSRWLQICQYCFQSQVSSGWQIRRHSFCHCFVYVYPSGIICITVLYNYKGVLFFFFPQNFCVRGLELFSSYLFKDILELYDWNLKGNFYLGKKPIQNWN